MEFLEKYTQLLEQNIERAVTKNEPNGLYDPIKYILKLGGKRIRPILTLMTCDFFGKNAEEALNAGLAVELFHNFSLIHDDIMDNAPLRRGEQTVHEKWDLNTGILSGDAMLILAYRFFEEYEPKKFQELAKLFSTTALQVCEGQQYDVDFESREDVTLLEYLKMIEYKTAVLIGAAMQMGAIVADSSKSCQENIYNFGNNLGIAFQLQDDYLDVFGNPETFGKQVGGDIISNKKTYLYLKAIEFGDEAQKEELQHLYSISPKDSTDKIETVKQIFITSGASKATENEITKYTVKANKFLETLEISEEKKKHLQQFGDWLMLRKK